MRRPWAAALVCGLIALAGLTVAALTTSTTLAFTLGVPSATPSPPIKPGHVACQKPITVPPAGDFDRVDFEAGTYYRRGPALDVVVRSLQGPPLRRHGVLAAGYPDVGVQQRQVVDVGEVPGGTLIEVCLRNRGPGDVAFFGNTDGWSAQSTGYVDGAAVGYDFDVVFRRDPRSFATLLPDMARRASLFRPAWVGPGLYWGLLALLLVGVPLLIARALRSPD